MAIYSLNLLNGFLINKKIDDSNKGFAGPTIEGISKVVQTDCALLLFFNNQELFEQCKQQTGWANYQPTGDQASQGAYALNVPIHASKTKQGRPVAYIACLHSHARKYAKQAYYLDWQFTENTQQNV